MIKFAEAANKIKKYLKDNKGILALLGCIYLITLYPLFRANFNYRDDGGRVLWAFDGWQNFGRVTSNTLSHIIHADTYLKDISPLTQIIAIVIIVLASLALLKIICGDRKLTAWDAICVLPLGLFPYFLCCFSYKFDSPYMALSVLVSVVPLLLRKNKKAYYIAAFVCTMLMCTTYQASAGIFPMLVVYTAFADWKNGEDGRKTIKYCLFSALAYAAAMLLFLAFVPINDGGYVEEKVSFGVLSIKHIIENYITYISTFKDDFRIKWFAVIAIISVVTAVRSVIDTKRNKLVTLVLCGVAYALMLLLSFGAYPLLDEPFLMPRGMYGAGVFVTMICAGSIPTCWESDKKSLKIISRISVLALGWLCVVFTCTYGNSLSAQKSYDEFRAHEVAEELAELEPVMNGEDIRIQLVGNAGYAAGIDGIPSDEILYRLMQPPFGGDNAWSALKLFGFCGLPDMESVDVFAADEYQSWSIAHENCYHTIYVQGNDIVVELK